MRNILENKCFLGPSSTNANCHGDIYSGRFCDDKILETQEHLGEYMGLLWERRNLKMDTEGGKMNFFKRVEKKLG